MHDDVIFYFLLCLKVQDSLRAFYPCFHQSYRTSFTQVIYLIFFGFPLSQITMEDARLRHVDDDDDDDDDGSG